MSNGNNELFQKSIVLINRHIKLTIPADSLVVVVVRVGGGGGESHSPFAADCSSWVLLIDSLASERQQQHKQLFLTRL